MRGSRWLRWIGRGGRIGVEEDEEKTKNVDVEDGWMVIQVILGTIYVVGSSMATVDIGVTQLGYFDQHG